MVSSFFTTAGLSPAGLTALWAARRVEWRRARFRPMTSDVSALSSVVANGHQALPTFSPPPLKFRTVGFPQYGFKRACRWRPSPAGRAYTPFKWRPGTRVFSPGIRPGHASKLTHTGSSNGPWLPRGLCCPTGSTLTMAISEPLQASRQFNVYIRLAQTLSRQPAEGPQFTLSVLCGVPSSILR